MFAWGHQPTVASSSRYILMSYQALCGSHSFRDFYLHLAVLIITSGQFKFASLKGEVPTLFCPFLSIQIFGSNLTLLAIGTLSPSIIRKVLDYPWWRRFI